MSSAPLRQARIDLDAYRANLDRVREWMDPVAVVQDLAARAYTVIQGARDPDTAPEVDGDVRAVRLDVTDAESLAALAGGLEHVDVLVNNAAISYDSWNRAATTDLDFIRAASVIGRIPAASSLARKSM